MPKPPEKWVLKKEVAGDVMTLCDDDVGWLLRHPVMRIANVITRIA